MWQVNQSDLTEAVLQRQRLALFGVSNKMIHIFMRAFEFSYRASALVTHPELLGHVSNT